MEPLPNTSYGVQTPGGMVTWAFAIDDGFLWLVTRGLDAQWLAAGKWRMPQDPGQVESWLKETVVPDLDERLAMMFPVSASVVAAEMVQSTIAANIRRACQYIATGHLGRPMFVYCPPEDPHNV